MGKQTSLGFALLLYAGLICGCGEKQLDNAIQDTRAAGKEANTAFIAVARSTLAIADEGWQRTFNGTHELIDARFTAWMEAQGYAKDGDTINPEPIVSFALMVPAIRQRDKEVAELTASREKWTTHREKVLAAIEDYEKALNRAYDTETDAWRAKEERREAVQTLLKTLGGAGAAVGTMFIVGA